MLKEFKFIEKLSEISNSDIDELLSDKDSPFIRYQFLQALEESKSVSNINGWKPNHLVSIDDKKITGFMPLYLKDNSQGEFVFDHSWSYSLNRAGRRYYPKLLTAVPFTPCETRKIISKNNVDKFVDATKNFMSSNDIETWHVLYPDHDLKENLKKCGLVERSGYKFIWNNRNFKDFEDYLKIFKSRQRKNIRNERKKISDYGIEFIVKDSDSLSIEDWDVFYNFYKNTYEQRLQRPYLNYKFFELIQKNKYVLRPIIFFAKLSDEIIAGSLCFRDKDNLYGRNWGTKYDIDSLHFECCYYQGIDYCINNGISHFDPGVQGEHKIRRGFEPITTHSYHLIMKDDFRKAISDFCIREKEEIQSYLEACKRYTPFNKEYKI